MAVTCVSASAQELVSPMAFRSLSVVDTITVPPMTTTTRTSMAIRMTTATTMATTPIRTPITRWDRKRFAKQRNKVKPTTQKAEGILGS